MSFSFTDAAPVSLAGPGRAAEPNPFSEIVKSIAMKVDDAGKPIAKAFKLPFGKYEDDKPADDKAREFRKAMNQLARAGYLCNPQVTVRKHIEGDGKGMATVTFWTVEKIHKPRKDETPSGN
jgi:hypothetical protein